MGPITEWPDTSPPAVSCCFLFARGQQEATGCCRSLQSTGGLRAGRKAKCEDHFLLTHPLSDAHMSMYVMHHVCMIDGCTEMSMGRCALSLSLSLCLYPHRLACCGCYHMRIKRMGENWSVFFFFFNPFYFPFLTRKKEKNNNVEGNLNWIRFFCQ